ncbi:hypothetical protein [Mucilaginibacter sp.]
MGLYVANKVITPDRLDSSFTNPHDLLIVGVAFTGLFLNILIVSIVNKKAKKVLTLACYVFESASVLALLFIVFSRK